MTSAELVAPPRGAGGSTARRQIGGIVGAQVDGAVLARLRAALGPGAAVLEPPTQTIVAEWDVCMIGGEPLRAWDSVLSSGRLAEVEGAFAVAWVDPAGALHLARDAVGERSLFYVRDDDQVVFASTVRALVASGVTSARVNRGALPAYLSYGYLPGRDTFVEGVFELRPGEHVTFAAGRRSSERFWTLPAEARAPRTDDEHCDELRGLIERAVARRLPDAGPLAATLSGGIDSSIVVAVARRSYAGPLAAYSLSFGPKLPDEIPFASMVARHCGVEHHVVELTPRAVMERFDRTIGALSTPIGEPLTVANALLFETIAPHSAVVLNGEGGDPCFGGPKNVPMLLHEVYGPPRGTRAANYRERAYLSAHRKCFDELELLVAPDIVTHLHAHPLENDVRSYLSDDRWPTLVNRLTAVNVAFKGGHHILPKVDHLSRLGGTLGRSPLFDRAVVEAALRMPAGLKLRGTVEKHALKRAFGDLLPREIVERPKSGMRVPVEAWLEGRRFDRFARERILDGLKPYELFQNGYLEELVRPRGAPMPRRGVKIWLLLSLEAWLRTVLNAP